MASRPYNATNANVRFAMVHFHCKLQVGEEKNKQTKSISAGINTINPLRFFLYSNKRALRDFKCGNTNYMND